MNLTLKDIPDSLHQRLREAAEGSGCSLDKLILHTLERAFCAHKSDRTVFLERIRLRREDRDVWIEDQYLADAIEDGRS